MEFLPVVKNLITDYHSNYESGNGYPDITFKAERNTKAVIIEIKVEPTGSDIATLSETALSQIEGRITLNLLWETG